MAALGKIRSKGVFLVAIIAFGLFAFIAEEAFRSCESTSNESKQQVGEILGEKISVQDFQKLIDEYTDVIKMTQGRDNLTDEELNQVKDQIWNTYVQSKIVEKEAKKIGLTVTDKEIENILNEGTNPMLAQTPFVNQQTGRFDANMLKKFLSEYKTMDKSKNPQAAEQYEKIYNFWTFIEKTLRQQTLATKYQSLLAHCLISNPISAKMAFEGRSVESVIQLASVPYSSINDNKVKITESDLKDKYDEMKEQFKQFIESRDIKYVDYKVVASPTDRAALNKEISGAANQLKNGADVAQTVRKASSLINYLGIPVSAKAFPQDIAARLDSMSVGQVYGPAVNVQDNSINVIKLISKSQMPDSIQYRQIQIGGATVDQARKTADSVYTAIKNGAKFEEIAKKYRQDGQAQWLTSAMYENSGSVEGDNKTYLQSIMHTAVNGIQNIAVTSGNVIVQVLAQKGMETKYDAAVIKKTIEFSKSTYSKAYNKFSQYVSESQDAKAIETNAGKFGYKVSERKDMYNSEHYVASIHGTRDAMKWIFGAKTGDVSPLYECGDNDHLLVMIMTKIHPVGYRSLQDVKDVVKAEVMKEKKYEMIQARMKGVNSIAAAKAKGAIVTNVNQVTFSSPTFVQATGASEPAISGAVAATAAGKFCPRVIKGNAAGYMFQVVNKTKRPGKFDDKTEEQQLSQQAMQSASRFMNELYLKAKVVDNRYLFF